MSAHDELVNAIGKASYVSHGGLTDQSDRFVPWEYLRPAHRENLENEFCAEDIATAILAAGYRKPRTITTVEELDTLPNGTVVLSKLYHSSFDGTPVSFQRWYNGDWHRGARSGSTHPDNFLPVIVLHEATP